MATMQTSMVVEKLEYVIRSVIILGSYKVRKLFYEEEKWIFIS
jgi:hypothetical protein